MPRPLPPPTDAQLMMLSAYLDGELSAAQEAEILDAMSQNPQLLEAFEAMTSAQLGAHGHGAFALEPSAAEADALVASVMAATAPAEVPASVEGALHLAQLAFDGVAEGDVPAAVLDAALAKPGAAPAVSGFVASAEATQAALRGVAQVASVVESLRTVPDHVGARVASAERFGVLASACLDGALTPAEDAELDAMLSSSSASASAGDPDEVPALFSTLHVGEALRAASTSTAFSRFASRAGEAALHAIEAERVQAAAPAKAAAAAAVASAPTASLFARLGAFFTAVRAPLAFAGAAAAIFFVVGRDSAPSNSAANDDAKREILAAWERSVVGDTGTQIARADLPLLADNSADVEAIDAAGTTVVFATESSNITVIWVDVDAEEGT